MPAVTISKSMYQVHQRIVHLLNNNQDVNRWNNEVFEGDQDETQIAEDQKPCIIVGPGSITDEPIDDQFFLVDVTGIITIRLLWAAWDNDMQVSGEGDTGGKGIVFACEDIKNAIEEESFLNEKLDWFVVSDADFDTTEFPQKSVDLIFEGHWRQQRNRRFRSLDK